METTQPGKRNISLIVGLSIPIAMVLFITVAINGPRWFNTVEPAKFDFLYTTGQDYTKNYVVEDGRLVDKATEDTANAAAQNQHELHFFVHDVSENRSREVSLEEAQAITLNNTVRSPDGFTIKPGRRGGWFIFDYGRDYHSRYLVKEHYSEKLNTESDNGSYSYYWNFRFVGWIAHEQ